MAEPLVTGAAARALRAGCHGLHMVLVFFALLGWLVPSASWLTVHLAFIPSLVAIWGVNGGVCPLNNLETRLTEGRWRNPDNVEEGSFILSIVERYLRLQPTQKLMDRITYGLMGFVWLLSWLHLGRLQGFPQL